MTLVTKSMNKYLLLLLLLLAQAGCKSVGETPRDSDLAGVYYRVKPKDTLGNIAKKHRLTVEEIMDINGIDDERALKVGQAIFLPDPDPIGKKIEKLKPQVLTKKSITKGKEVVKPKSRHTRIFDFPLPGGVIISRFSKSKDKPYDGIGIKAPLSSKVVCALDGQVLFVGDDGTRFGLLVIVEHAEPYITVYTQLDKAVVVAGQKLKKGQQLGTVGKSGGVVVPHLHFQIRVNKKPQDPEGYLKGIK